MSSEPQTKSRRERMFAVLFINLSTIAEMDKGKYSIEYRRGIYHGVLRGHFKVKSLSELTEKQVEEALDYTNRKIAQLQEVLCP